MTVATTDPQAAFDEEDAGRERGQVRKQADEVRRTLKQEALLRAKLKECRTELKFANRRFMSSAEDAGDLPPGEWIAGVGKSLRRVEAAREKEIEVRQEYYRALFARRQAQEGLQVRVRKQFDHYPLFDPPNQNGHAVHQEAETPTQDGPEVNQPAAWRDTLITAMNLPPATVRQLQHWGLQDAGQIADLLNDGQHVVGLNTKAHQAIIYALRMINAESEPCIQEIRAEQPAAEPKKRGRKKKEAKA